MDEAVLQNEEENEEILQYYSSNPHEPLKGCDCNLGFDDDYMYVWSGSGWGYSIIEYLSYPLWIWRYNLLTRRWSYCNVLDWPDDRKVPLGSENCTYASNEGFYLFLDIERNESAQYHFYICTKSQESTTFQCEPVEHISVGSNSKVDVDDRRYHFEFPMMCLDSDHFYFVRRGRTTQNYESFSCLNIYELRRMTKGGAWQWECISTNEAGDNLTYGDYKYIHDFLQSSSAFSLNLWHQFAFLFNKNVAVINCAPLDEDEMQISIQKLILFDLNCRKFKVYDICPDEVHGYPPVRCDFNTTVYDDRLYFMGGFEERGDNWVPLGDIWQLCLKTFTWKRMSRELAEPVFSFGVKPTMDGCIYAFGGRSAQEQLAFENDVEPPTPWKHIRPESRVQRFWVDPPSLKRLTMELLADILFHKKRNQESGFVENDCESSFEPLLSRPIEFVKYLKKYIYK